MTARPISRFAADILHASGWNAARKFDTTEYEHALELEGYPKVAAAVAFLQSFGGLDLVHPSSDAGGRVKHIVLDPKRTIAGVPFGWAKDYMRRLGEPLCAIGTAANGYLLLLMSDKGAVYAGFDDFLYFVADDGLQALDHLCSGHRLREIAEH